MNPRESGHGNRLLRWIGAGFLTFAAGAALAIFLLPEWSAGALRPRPSFQTQYRLRAGRAGFVPAPGKPRVSLDAGVGRQPGEPRRRTFLRARVSHLVQRPGEARGQNLAISFARNGTPVKIEWTNFSARLLAPPNPALLARLDRDLAAALLAPGESLGASRREQAGGMAYWRAVDLVGSSPGQHVVVSVRPPFEVDAERQPGRLAQAPRGPESQLGKGLVVGLINLPLLLAVAVIFLVLLLRGRIDLTNGAILAAVTLVSGNLVQALGVEASVWMKSIIVFFSTPARALWVFFAWSAGESLLRSLRPDFTTSLDTLRLGRLGPRGGRALLLGFGFGAVLAGSSLALYALSSVLPGLSPARPSLELPVFDVANSPIGSGIFTAAIAALAVALALRFLPERWALPAAALLAGWVLSPFQLYPFAVELAANTAFAGLLVWVCQRHGLTALLIAASVAQLLPAALFSALHPAWMPFSLVLTAGLLVTLLALGFAGISQSAEVETGYVPAPAFMRRLTEERRIHHEVDLLARMQLGLLPQELPKLPGYELAARSVLASEAGGDLYDFLRDDAGGFWLAAGDVAGHGYSCAIAQAMVKAGLLSLVEPEERPSEVLRQLDRVLRGATAERSFTSLALVRLAPATGDAVLANAGHPYPLLFADGKVTEIALPGLPLGQGPARSFGDREFQLPPGGALVLCSDGLFEALDAHGNAYGFERAREVFQVMGHRPAVEIVDALLNDCRRHLGGEEMPDDVTVVVMRRSQAGSASAPH